ncbi:MAG: EscU/YscU/HrcU family type III secretion system export apparatus switch protein [Spirochaetia bacterium]|nr:EscU/YscU/HrcU family type III secretion system export apparatus switch protein [Spirochaetia bacterium]
MPSPKPDERKIGFLFSYSGIDLQWFASAEDEGRTFDATEVKKRKSREEGKVAKSSDMISAVVLLAGVVVIFLLGGYLMRVMTDTCRFYFSHITEFDTSSSLLPYGFMTVQFLRAVLPIFAISVAVALLINIGQVGFFITGKPLIPKPDRIMPKWDRLKNAMFSRQAAFNLFKTFVKIACICGIAVFNIVLNWPNLLESIRYPLENGLASFFTVAVMISVESALFLLVFSIPDYFFQKKQYEEELKMTLTEFRDELKESEGNPAVKQKIREQHDRLIAGDIEAAVKTADVVVTNPTHFACVLAYNPERDQAPRLVLKGADFNALTIKKVAKKFDVPIVENKPLARSIYANVKQGDVVPPSFHEALVGIYRFFVRKYANGRTEEV